MTTPGTRDTRRVPIPHGPPPEILDTALGQFFGRLLSQKLHDQN